MRLFVCEEQRMLRALAPRWPHRRSHCRHDLHLLVEMHSTHCSSGGRARAAAVPMVRRRRGADG